MTLNVLEQAFKKCLTNSPLDADSDADTKDTKDAVSVPFTRLAAREER